MTLKYEVGFYGKGDEIRRKETSHTSSSSVSYHTHFFDSYIIGTDPYPHPVTQGPVYSELKVGQLFQVIKEQKRLSIIIDEKYFDEVHMLTAAQQQQTLLSFEIVLYRDATDVAYLMLEEVQVVQLLAIGSGSYALYLKVKGAASETDKGG